MAALLPAATVQIAATKTPNLPLEIFESARSMTAT
jgi:hypothetical protein